MARTNLDDVATIIFTVNGRPFGYELVAIVVTPSSVSLLDGEDVQLSATAFYSNGKSYDVTRAVVWSSSDPTIVTVTNGAAGGLLTGIAVGSATVSAGLDGVLGFVSVVVPDSAAVNDYLWWAVL